MYTPGPFDLGESLADPTKLVAPEGDRLDRRHGNLRHPNPVRISIKKEDVDRTGFHGHLAYRRAKLLLIKRLEDSIRAVFVELDAYFCPQIVRQII